jgi:hypothetical protein
LFCAALVKPTELPDNVISDCSALIRQANIDLEILDQYQNSAIHEEDNFISFYTYHTLTDFKSAAHCIKSKEEPTCLGDSSK